MWSARPASTQRHTVTGNGDETRAETEYSIGGDGASSAKWKAAAGLPELRTLTKEPTMPRYASNTAVSVENSMREIRGLLRRYGAEQFSIPEDLRSGAACVVCRIRGRFLRLEVPAPRQEDYELTPAGKLRKGPVLRKAKEQAFRQRWRALKLLLQALLEAVEDGIADFETVFMPWVMLPNGQTVGQAARPAIAQSYETGTVPAGLLLPAAIKK